MNEFDISYLSNFVSGAGFSNVPVVSSDSEKASGKVVQKNESPFATLKKVVSIAQRKPSKIKNITIERIKKEAKEAFLEYLHEYYTNTFDEKKF